MSKKRSKTGRAWSKVRDLEAKVAQFEKDASGFARVWIDRWLEEGAHLSEVSAAALVGEVRRRLDALNSKINRETYEAWSANTNSMAGPLTYETLSAALNKIHPPPDIRDILPPGESVTVNGVVFTGRPHQQMTISEAIPRASSIKGLSRAELEEIYPP